MSLELQLHQVVWTVGSRIVPPCDASCRNSCTWLLACLEGSILFAVSVVVVEVVGLVVVQTPLVAAAARIPRRLLMLHPLVLLLVDLPLALSTRRGKVPFYAQAGSSCSILLLAVQVVVSLKLVFHLVHRAGMQKDVVEVLVSVEE